MKPTLLPCCLLLCIILACQSEKPAPAGELPPLVTNVEAQPLLAQAGRLSEALTYIGSPLPEAVRGQLAALQEAIPDARTVQRIQELLDPYCLAAVNINPESRVKVQAGPAPAELRQEGWTTFLVKVHNEAGVTAPLEVQSPQALPLLHRSSGQPRVKEEHILSAAEVENRFLELSVFRDRPLKAKLSGLELEYAVLMIYTRHRGKREAQLGFHVGQGTQDIGFRNTIDILFEIRPAVKVVFDIKDEDGQPVMASLLIMDGIERFAGGDAEDPVPDDYRLRLARLKRGGATLEAISEWAGMMYIQPEQGKGPEADPPKRLSGIYPLPARRAATRDEYPDFFFQPQVYRRSGEHVYLPPGRYQVVLGRGPEYYSQLQTLDVPAGKDSVVVPFNLQRWVHMKELGWYSGDHHIHAAGCSHYESPAEGVLPEHMWRQIQGEDLNLGSNLTWGPSWYHQKQFFSGETHPLSDSTNLLRYDVEVSGFPSSHAGHLVLLNLQEDDYPQTTTIEEWPSWTLPILRWAKEQGGITGYAHSGWGLAPVTPTDALPNYELPRMDGIGANEYIVTVTQYVIDFYSAGDTPIHWELNSWYHTLNCGFRVRLSGETDFPCISDERVGATRSYAKLDDNLSFAAYMDALRRGRTYVSDGFSHLIDFQVNGRALGEQQSELKVAAGTELRISGRATAFLSATQGAAEAQLATQPLDAYPYWHVERSRLGQSRKVAVELIFNGVAVDRQEITADGSWSDLAFDYTPERSGWMALRIFPSSHTNPIFVLVDDQPIALRESAEWCLAAVDQCWKEKQSRIREEERIAARAAYDAARAVYGEIARRAR